MAEPIPADFDSLCAERDALRGFLMSHARSVEAFREKGKPWFKRQANPDRPSDKPVRHLTTTVSCLQSLYDVPLYAGSSPPPPSPPPTTGLEKRRAEAVEDFTTALLSSDSDKDVWKTEDESLLYTKVRTLPILLAHGNQTVLGRFKDPLRRRTEEVWKVLKIEDMGSHGIGEPHNPGEGYPPNAFHTYWAIRLLREYRRWEEKAVLEPLSEPVASKEAVARLWARNTLATQAALINARQERVDAQQLAWALSTDALCHPLGEEYPTTTETPHAEVYRVALQAFFREQEDGHWRLYEPLFHYRSSGNAYCYSFETLAELLRLALLRGSGRLLRAQLRPFAGNLINAWHYARAAAMELPVAGAVGWSSGHHPHRTKPEAWATASVFSYLQHLRCIIGYWAAEEARGSLNARPPGGDELGDTDILETRGVTWQRGDTPTVGQQMSMLFLHPIKATEVRSESVDPDEPLVSESRSALLFGPPGTGKTTLVKGLAKALGWSFVEVLSSDFLSEGMDQVPKAADRIFKTLMELDHCVILFDEIDELIRVRDDGRSDPFGRFLTTSMLPKLAKLWEQRRVLFFVNTNDIEVADPAIKRSQRFDAAMFVPPPSFEKKKDELEHLLDRAVSLTKSEVEEALHYDGGDGNKADPLGVFALLRWDQLSELEHRVRLGERNGAASDSELLGGALEALGLELAASDWKQSESGPIGVAPHVEDKGGDPIAKMYERWNRQELSERRDRRARAVLRLNPSVPSGNDLRKFGSGPEYLVYDAVVEPGLNLDHGGTATLEIEAWVGRDEKGIFLFEQASTPPPDPA